MEQITLIDADNTVFEIITVPAGKHEAILFANRVFLPAGKGKFKECDFHFAPLPPVKGLV